MNEYLGKTKTDKKESVIGTIKEHQVAKASDFVLLKNMWNYME